ncbi:flagellar basal body P-ring formation chaperone FlgA [Pseudothermotoga sp. U03pept]|uniref:flagellar basal body P-ring formation chaperone FlgA n=1 Tax=Pseudothermotoga sp. U03pept TaxID=3447012 RepID=UPI003EFCBE4E
MKKFILVFLIVASLVFGNDLSQSLKKSIESYLLLQLGKDATVTNVQFKSNPPQADNFEILSWSLSNGKASLLIKLFHNESFSGYLQATAEVMILRNIVVACRTIKSGEMISQNDVVLALVNVLNLRAQFTEKEELVVGKIAKKMFREGEPIDLTYTAKAPDVKAGQTLLATAQIGSVAVTTFVRLLHDANFGDLIKARNISTGLLIQGVLKEDMTVHVMGS